MRYSLLHQFLAAFLTTVAALAFTACAGPAKSADPPGDRPDGIGPVPERPSRTIADDRAQNQRAYDELYRPLQTAIRTSDTGRWLAIADGRLHPTIDGLVTPAKSLALAVRYANQDAPDAVHRFVFQIGEEGDIHWPLGGCELDRVAGTRMMALLERDDVEMKGLGGRLPWRAKFGDAMQPITVHGTDGRLFLSPRVGAPGKNDDAPAVARPFCLATGFVGTLLLPAVDAKGLELWEIPGQADVEGLFRRGRCRRAMARIHWPGSELDFVVPVAIWP